MMLSKSGLNFGVERASRALVLGGLLGSWALSGCAASQSEAQSPSAEEPAPVESAPAESADSPETAQAEPAAEPASSSAVEPTFTPGMSVTEAINAVPQGAERVNIEQEVLAEPLTKPELYEPCKLKPNQHFKVKLAVWDGKAVGMDITTTPHNEALTSCIREQLEKLAWEDKVKSLNTVEFAF